MIWFALDTGSSRNACALAGVERDRNRCWCPVVLREWVPSVGAPLDLRLGVLPEAAAIVQALGGKTWATDAYAIDQVKIVAPQYGIATVVPTTNQRENWRHLAAVLARGKLALQPTGRPDRPSAEMLTRLRSQLDSVQRRVSGGEWEIVIKEVNRMHGDLAVAFARALWLAKAADVDLAPKRAPLRGASEYASEIATIDEL